MNEFEPHFIYVCRPTAEESQTDASNTPGSCNAGNSSVESVVIAFFTMSLRLPDMPEAI